jgi:hypothetical protein
MNSIGTVHGWAFGRWSQASQASSSVAAASAAPAKVGRGAFDTLADAVLKAVGSADSSSKPDRSFDGLALALRDALASGDGSQGAVDGLLKKISDALGAARSSLVAGGLSERDADRAIAAFQDKLAASVGALATRITSQVPATGTSTPAPASSGDATDAAATPSTSEAAGAAASAARATWSVDQKLGVKLVTQEGDVVRIRLRQSEGFDASAAQRGAAAYAAVSSYSSSRFTIDVQGSLSQSELDAISGVLGQVDKIAGEFYSGDVASAFADASSLNYDPTVLAKVGLKMSQTETLRLSSVSIGAPAQAPAVPATPTAPAAPTLPSPSDPTLPVDSTAQAASSTAATDSTTATDAAASSSSASASATPDTATTTPTPSTPTSGADAIQKSVLGFIRDLIQSLGSTTTSGRVTITARAKLELAVVAIDGARAQSSPTEKAATGLLGATVAKLTDA